MADDGTAYLADAGNNRILRLDETLSLTGEWAGVTGPEGTLQPFNAPTGVFRDREGHLYIADSGNNRVVKMDGEGRLLQTFLAPEEEDVQKLVEYKPSKVLVDNSGVVYVLVGGL